MFLPFLYFAYGSNLLASRIHTSIPHALRSDVAKLKDYRLDFDLYSPHWRGCPATIAPHKGKEVWGVLWEIGAEDLVKLDQQEKVYEDFYSRYEVEVELMDGKRKKCFVYAHKEASQYYPLSELPEERRPSQIYLNQVIAGAEECNLPKYYQNMLREVPDNGENFQPDYNIMTGTFLYFAYGSNLLARRIHQNNPSAVRAGFAKLKNYRLDFDIHSNFWHGCSATVTPHEGLDVWGALWEIGMEDLPSLDKQESVHLQLYFRSEVEVELLDNTKKKCFVYQHVKVPEYIDCKCLPAERQPSLIYMKTIIEGAKESKLPEKYLKFLKSVSHNGNESDVNFSV